MSHLDFNEVKLFEDTKSDADIIKSIIDTKSEEDAFYILDVNDVIQKHLNWIAKMPRVTPHYAIKCNPDPTVIKILAAMNASFDCASEQEIRQVIKYGVIGDRIIFANPTKCPSHIKYAKKMDVDKMTVDGEIELLKINNLFPEARYGETDKRIVIRIRCDAKVSQVPLGAKFGCDPDEEAIRLIHLTKSLGLTLHGFSFHVGSSCGELKAYSRGIAICKRLITVARTIGCKDVQLIDIGGGFMGDTGYCIDKLASVINDAVLDIDPSITIISEPGRYYVASAFTLASYLHTKKIIPRGEKMIRMYYINCGVHTSFVEEWLNYKARIPIPLYKPTRDEKFPSFVWGPTCDSLDCILKDVLLPELDVGDWLIWRDMGAYSISLSCPFNGFSAPLVYPIIRKGQWQSFINYVNDLQKSQKCLSWKNGIENTFIETTVIPLHLSTARDRPWIFGEGWKLFSHL